MKIFWYINSLLSIIFILLHNPKSEGFSNLRIQGRILNSSKRMDKTLEILTWSTIMIFFIFIILFGIYKI